MTKSRTNPQQLQITHARAEEFNADRMVFMSEDASMNERVFMLGVATVARNGLTRFKYSVGTLDDAEQLLWSGILACHNIRRATNTVEFFSDMPPFTPLPNPRVTAPDVEVFDLDKFIRKTKLCSSRGLANTLNATQRKIINSRGDRKGLARHYTYTDIKDACRRLRVFAQPEDVKKVTPSIPHQSEENQMIYLMQNQTDISIISIPGNCQMDIVIYNKTSGEIALAGLKNCTNFVRLRPTMLYVNFSHLKAHNFTEICSSPLGHIIIHSQQNDIKTLNVHFQDGKINNMSTIPHDLLTLNTNVLKHVLDSQSYDGFMELNITPYMRSYSSKLGALWELLAMLVFGGKNSQTHSASVSDITVNNKTVQNKLMYGGKHQMKFKLKSTHQISYDEIDIYAHAIIYNNIIRIYRPLENATFRPIIESGTNSFSTCYMGANGFPLPIGKFFKVYADVNLTELLAVAKKDSNDNNIQGCREFLEPVRVALDMEYIFGKKYSPYGDLDGVGKIIMHKLLTDLVRWVLELDSGKKDVEEEKKSE